MKKRLAVFGLVLLSASALRAGQSGGAFLELPSSVRAGGMAETFTALADEPFGLNYNPAGIAFVPSPMASFLHQVYVQDVTAEFLGFVQPLGRVSLAAAPALLSMKEEPVYDAQGAPTGATFQYEGTLLPGGVSYRKNNSAAGAVVKYYSEKIAGFSQNATTLDVGTLHRISNYRFGAAGQNLVGRLGDYDLPRTLRLGAAYEHKFVTVAVDAGRQLVQGKNIFSAGAEFAATAHAALRTGYRSQEFGGLSAGIGRASCRERVFITV